MGRFALVSLGWLILAISLSGAGAQLCCPFNWYPYSGFCYKVFDKKFRTWKDAEVFCTEQNAGCHLASFHSEAETNAIFNYLDLVGSAGHVWIGLSRVFQHRTWQWSDGSKFNYTNWNHGEPNNFLMKNENCVELWTRSGEPRWWGVSRGCTSNNEDMFDPPWNFRWNDEVCSWFRHFLCKCPLEPESEGSSG
ncbi:C-type lectin lectoxin-Thr1-like [Candoia aspera]|uniref:C-type lectin lectoxin-Thr1-like n=1 Tax=Candoia aspera TaxID=51853 RepID=UPI002FD84BDE